MYAIDYLIFTNTEVAVLSSIMQRGDLSRSELIESRVPKSAATYNEITKEIFTV